MSAQSTVSGIVITELSGLSAFSGVPITAATDFRVRDETDNKRGAKGAVCWVRATEQRIAPNYPFYRVSVLVAIETHVAPGEDEDGAALVAMSDAVADWLHGVTGRDAAIALGFDGILPGQVTETSDGMRVQRQHPFDVMISYTPAS